MPFPRLPRFSLATLLLLIACLAAYLGGYKHGRRAAFVDWLQPALRLPQAIEQQCIMRQVLA